MTYNVLRSGVALMALCVFAACASVVPKLVAPRVEVVRVTPLGGSLKAEKFRVTLHATNPNNRSIPVHGIDCELQIANAHGADCQTDAAFVLPALGETDFDVTVVADLGQVLGAALLGLGRGTVDYHVHGHVHLDSGLLRVFPFDQRGTVKLN